MYFLYSSIFIALSIISIKDKKLSLKLFLLISCAIPSSFAFEKQVSLYGFYFFEHFYWIAIPLALASSIKKGAPRNSLIALSVAFALAIYIAINIPFYSDDKKYLIRDLRLSITLMASAALFILFRDTKLTPKEITKITFLCATFTITSYLAWLLGLFDIKNEYYNQENRYRYFAGGTYLCAAYLIFAITNKAQSADSKLRQATILLCTIVVFISGYRVLILALAFGIVLSTIKNPLQAFRAILASAALVFIGIKIAFAFEIERITSALDATGVLIQLNTRYGPALSLIDNFDGINYIFGMGAGKTFDIPWFEYQGLDTKHNMVDSTYLTLFVKFGILSAIYILTLLSLFTVSSPQKTKTAAIGFISIMMVTFPISYHPTLILMTLPLFIMNNSAKSLHER